MGKVGIAPGTTTLNIQPGGSVNLVGVTQDPGVSIRNQEGNLAGLGYFDARPTDMELAKIRGYVPVHRGWISAKVKTTPLSDSCCPACESGSGSCPSLSAADLFGFNRNVAISIGAGMLGALAGFFATRKRGAAASSFAIGLGSLTAGLVGSKIAERVVPITLPEGEVA